MSDRNASHSRPDKFTHFLNRARVVAERSTCMRRKIGSVIIKDGVELSSGYVGSPRGTEHCITRRECMRMEMGIPSGERYELCRSVHAEQNAIINAARTGISIIGGEIYIFSERMSGAYPEDRESEGSKYAPCMMCMKEIVNAGLVSVHMVEEGNEPRTFTHNQLIDMLADEESKAKIRYLK